MTNIERYFYNKVKNRPWLKNILRNAYQLLFSIFPQQKAQTTFKITGRKGYFFGFHDKSPFSNDNQKILSHKLHVKNSTNLHNDIEVGYFSDKSLTNFISLGKTASWNFQQGSMLQWVNNNIGFNHWDGRKNKFKIVDITGKLINELEIPIGIVNKNGLLGIGFSFDRLGKGMSGYGYKNIDSRTNFELTPKKEGLYLGNFQNGSVEMIFNLYELSELKKENSMQNAFHFVTHAQFSQDNKTFFFLHRWKTGNKRIYSRIIVSDLKGTIKSIIQTNGMVSHLTWLGKNQILAYSSITKIGDGHHIFSIMNNNIVTLDKNIFPVDGHPQYLDKINCIVCDTYPNKFRLQELFLIDNKKRINLGKFKSPHKYRDEFRCDLHPRWDRLGKSICFDSAHEGKRGIYILDL